MTEHMHMRPTYMAELQKVKVVSRAIEQKATIIFAMLSEIANYGIMDSVWKTPDAK